MLALLLLLYLFSQNTLFFFFFFFNVITVLRLKCKAELLSHLYPSPKSEIPPCRELSGVSIAICSRYTIIKSHPNKTTVPPTSLPVCTWENTVVHSGGERERESEREREIGGHLVSAIHLEAKQC